MSKFANMGGSTPPFVPPAGGGGMSGIFSRGPGGVLPERGSDMQRQMVQAALQQAGQSVGGSGSPLLAFLAPMVGGAVGSRTEGLYKTAEDERKDSAMDQAMTQLGGDDKMRSILDLMADPDLPPEVGSLLKASLTDMMKQGKGASTGGSRRSSAPRRSGGGQSSPRLYGEYPGPDGILYGRTRTGELVPYTTPGGDPYRTPGSESASPAAPTTPLAQPGAAGPSVMSTSPTMTPPASGMPGPTESDPLGIRNG